MNFPTLGIWKVAIPKKAILKLVESMDADQDGYIQIGEIRGLLKKYGKDVKSSVKFARR